MDDNALVRGGLRLLFDDEADISIVGEATSLDDLNQVIERQNPQVILMDISLGEGQPNGIQCTKFIRKNGYTGEIICLTSFDSPEYKKEMNLLGVSEFLTKGQDLENIVKSIRHSVNSTT